MDIDDSRPDHLLHRPTTVSQGIRKFNEIAVLVFPDVEHTFIAPKVAILQFRLLPRGQHRKLRP